MSNEVTVSSFNVFMSQLKTYSSLHLRPVIIFGDQNNNLTLSIQASVYHYCLPRKDSLNEYTHYEVGFPSKKEELLMPYIEVEGDNPTETVYPFVPVEVLVNLANNYGGIVGVSNA